MPAAEKLQGAQVPNRYTCIHVYIYICQCVYAYKYIYLYIYKYIYIYIDTYTHIHSLLFEDLFDSVQDRAEVPSI